MGNYDLFDSVGWQRWSESGYSQKPSKTHLLETGDDGEPQSLCGVKIPWDEPGVEIDGDIGEGYCTKCMKTAKKWGLTLEY